MTAHQCASPGMRSDPSNWGNAETRGHSNFLRRFVEDDILQTI